MKNKCYVIPVEKFCNANCLFCITKTRDYNKGSEFLEINDKFLENLNLLKRRGVKYFEITGGGEPFLNKNLDVIVYLIKNVIPESYVKVYTNGNILRPVYNIDEIDISLVHYDFMVNQKFMRASNQVGLNDKLKFFRNMCSKLRLSIPLIKGAIDSKEELQRMIDYTSQYVDEYVVRTLYPGTPLGEKLYVDFEYDRENVVFERDNNLGDFYGIILHSDGNFYSDFNLNNKRQMYSYLMLKPDARTYVDKIESIINSFQFEVKYRFLLEDFCNQAIQFYKDKEKEYLEIVKRHLKRSAYLFGNQGLVYVLDGDKSFKGLERDTVLLKEAIRKECSFTHHIGGYLIVGENKSHLNLVHSPDGDFRNYERDLSLLESFSDKRLVSDEEFSKVLKYRSFNL